MPRSTPTPGSAAGPVPPSRIVLPAAPEHLADVLASGGAVAWEEPLIIDTYAVGKGEELPIFSESRVYQGSSGRVYPLPYIEEISRTKAERVWRAIHLENRWVRLVVLPELGGRIHVGYDKVAEYDFFYRNNVIKPALVGLAGPWVSGGVEFNWPQHHRPATYFPVDTDITTDSDGSVTVWCTDHDPFTRMRASHGILLRPDSSRVELRVRLHNRTEDRQTFLWWANVAARSHEHYQSFFPPDVHYVADHARRAVTAFPRADRPYYGVDYPARVSAANPDADRLDCYGNIPVPTSYMVLDTRDDFFGGYDHDAQAGFVHWADRRIAPGKKQWTWGNAPFGWAWDRQLTDGDGPYVELMAGVFTDNQPDFSFLAPGEVREFTQTWFPISRIGIPVHATPYAAIAVDVVGLNEGETPRLRIGIMANVADTCRLIVRQLDGAPLLEQTAEVGPDGATIVDVPTALSRDELAVELRGSSGMALAWWTPPTDPQSRVEPDVATEPPPPAEIDSTDELYLTGVHLSQYRHPTRSPEPYWEEVLRRDPGDARTLTALATRAYARGEYDLSEDLLSRSIARMTKRNPNPVDTEAYYRWGLTLTRLGRSEEALDAFARAEWTAAWAHPARLEQARIHARSGRLEAALAALPHHAPDPRVGAARVVLLRRLGHTERAESELRKAIEADPRDVLLGSLAGRDPVEGHELLDVAGELRAMGDSDGAVRLLTAAQTAPTRDGTSIAAIASYLLACVLEGSGYAHQAQSVRRQARQAPVARAFPEGLDAYDALVAALDDDPLDPVASQLLATWLYAHGRREHARIWWQRAHDNGVRTPGLLRNLAVATVTVLADDSRAASYLDEALDRAPEHARLLLERDLLARRLDEGPAQRLDRLERHPAAVQSRDDLVVLKASLLAETGAAVEAIGMLTAQSLRAWEGGEGQALRTWDRAHLALAEAALANGDQLRARAWVEAAQQVPRSLGEERHLLDSTSEFAYLLGRAGDPNAFARCVGDPADPVTFPDRPADRATYFVGRCAMAMGDLSRAEACWTALEVRAGALEAAPDSIDYFATSVPELSIFGLDHRAPRRAAADLRRYAARGRTQESFAERRTKTVAAERDSDPPTAPGPKHGARGQ